MGWNYAPIGVELRTDKIDCYLQLMILYDMSYYIKLTVLSIKTIPRSLALFVLQILAV